MNTIRSPRRETDEAGWGMSLATLAALVEDRRPR
jgi:hypothetical protein